MTRQILNKSGRRLLSPLTSPLLFSFVSPNTPQNLPGAGNLSPLDAAQPPHASAFTALNSVHCDPLGSFGFTALSLTAYSTPKSRKSTLSRERLLGYEPGIRKNSGF